MRAAVWRGTKNLSIERTRVPEPAAGEAVLRVHACAICGSDVRTYFHGNDRVRAPRILGHEIAGVIVDVAADVRTVNVGDRVTIGADLPCGDCRACERGRPNLCPRNLAIGYQFDGGFAEFMRVPAVALAGGPVRRFSSDLTFDEAALAEPLACCLNGLELGRMEAGHVVAVWGAGPIGTMLVDLARQQGAGSIFVIDVDEARLAALRQRRPDVTTLDGRGDVRTAIMDLTRGHGVDLALTANSAIESHRQALGCVAKRGTLNFFGGLPRTAPPTEISSNWLHYNEITLTGSHGSTPRQHAEAIRLIEGKHIAVGDLISHRFALADIGAAFDTAIGKTGLKVMVNPHEA